jgi:hypothetical protein
MELHWFSIFEIQVGGATTLYQQKLALTSPTSGGRSVGIVLSRTQATEFSFLFWRGQLAYTTK